MWSTLSAGWNLFRSRTYTLWQTNIAIENHHFEWINQLFLWPFSIAMLNYQRVYNGMKSCMRNRPTYSLLLNCLNIPSQQPTPARHSQATSPHYRVLQGSRL